MGGLEWRALRCAEHAARLRLRPLRAIVHGAANERNSAGSGLVELPQLHPGSAIPLTQDGPSSPGQDRSSSPDFTPAVNVSHSAGVKVSTGPVRSLESRTATMPGRLRATSTQPPPLPPL